MGEVPVLRHEIAAEGAAAGGSSQTSLRELWLIVVRQRRVAGSILGGLLATCLLYCLVAPRQYEATAKVALRTTPGTSLSLEEAASYAAASLLSSPVQQETLANALRSEQLAWRVIRNQRLYSAAGFSGRFEKRFPSFNPESPSPDAQAWLLDRFAWRLQVQSMPRTLLVRIRFRCGDAALSAAVVNGLITAYEEQENESRTRQTAQSSLWLRNQLAELKTRVDEDEGRLAAFQSEHNLLSFPETLPNGQQTESQHLPAGQEVDELSRQLVSASADRIVREAEFRAASEGDPELVIASDPRLQVETGNFSTALLQQIRTRRSELELEKAQLELDHGPNFPRVVEIGGQLQDLSRQGRVEDGRLVEQFRLAWKTAREREDLVRKALEEVTREGLKENRAAAEYAMMREEADRSRELYLRVQGKVDEAGLAAGVHGSSIEVVDRARVPAMPATPDLPLYMAITFFAALWLSLGGALMAELLRKPATGAVALVVIALLGGVAGLAQAPTPSTSGLPSGVARLPQSKETKSIPNPKEAATYWDNEGAKESGAPAREATLPGMPMPAPIGPGDVLEVGEFRTPEFRSSVRVSSTGTVILPMIREVQVGGLDEIGAAHAIEQALKDKGMLLHPQVTVLVTAYAGQDVSVLGEVARPGVYAYTVHHRLLDLLSAAQGLAPAAGRLVNIFHRDDPQTAHPVVLDPGGTEGTAEHNPELLPGDTVQVSRAGLVFVVGDVVRPGGFPVDPAQGLTVVQALSLAWGPTQNAAATKAVLIREEKGGRTMATLNLRRMLNGQEPDQPVRDRDILFVPDSQARNLWNRTMESVVQSAAGVSIYAGLVYSQRF